MKFCKERIRYQFCKKKISFDTVYNLEFRKIADDDGNEISKMGNTGSDPVKI